MKLPMLGTICLPTFPRRLYAVVGLPPIIYEISGEKVAVYTHTIELHLLKLVL